MKNPRVHKSLLYSETFIPVGCDGQETEDGAYKRHTQQGVHHVVQLQLGGTRLPQVAHVSKHDHQVLPGLGDACDGVEGRQAADEAVHGRVEVPVPHDGHHDQQVLSQAHHAHGEEEGDGDLHLGAVGLVQ